MKPFLLLAHANDIWVLPGGNLWFNTGHGPTLKPRPDLHLPGFSGQSES
mgnify:CR=1 FL=1